MASRGSKRDGSYRDDLARRVAILHYEDQLSPAQIFAELRDEDVRSIRDIRSLIARAREVPLVRVRVELVGERPSVDPDLAAELASVGQLRKAIVVKSSLASDEKWKAEDDAERLAAYREADALHYQLGQTAAEFVLDMLRDGDSVGVGPGRGVGFTAHGLKKLVGQGNIGPLQLQIFSLAGTMWAEAWSGRMRARSYLDADENAHELAIAVGVAPGEGLKLVRLPLFLDTGEDSGTAAEREILLRHMAPHVTGDDWTAETGEARISLAIFGVGALNTAAPGVGGAHYTMWHPNPQEAVSKDIRALRETIVPSCQGAIVDISDRFWLRRGGEGLDADVRDAAVAALDSLNSKIVSVSFAKLQNARQRLVVAGGMQKYDAVLALMTEHQQIGVRPTVLVTDHLTARRLLKDIPRFRTSTPDEARSEIAVGSHNDDESSSWLSDIASLAASGSSREGSRGAAVDRRSEAAADHSTLVTTPRAVAGQRRSRR